MREALLLTAAAGCAATALLFGKSPDYDWGSVLVSVLVAGTGGALLAAATA